MNKENTTHVDATELNCPVPLMMLKRAIEPLKKGDVVVIDVTDVHAELDFEIWCEKFNHSLIKLKETPQSIQFKVVKSG